MRLPNMYGLVTASALLLGATSANALTLEIDDLTNPGVEVSLIDSLDLGVLNYNSATDGAVGDFAVVVSTGLGVPNVGGPGEAEIDLSVQARSSGVDQLRVTLTDTGLGINAVDSGATAITSSFSVNANADGASATVESFISVAGGAFESLSSFSSVGEENFIETLRQIIAPGDTFDLRTVITLNYTKLAFASADANLNVAPVPLPAALPLFLTALVGLGFIGRQRRRQAA